MYRFLAGLTCVLVLGGVRARGAIMFGQLDDFQNGSTMGWDEGFSSPNPPFNVSTGGPDGAGDRFVRNDSSGGSGAGSMQVMFNRDQWAGNYNAAGVTRISGWVANLGGTELHVRLALAGAGARFSSTDAHVLPAGSGWRRVSFDLTASEMTALGTVPLSAALSAVNELRLLSARAPAFVGDPVVGSLGVDDLRAMRPEGDANFDGRVNAGDLRVVRRNLGITAGGTWAQGDFNFDGRVNGWDYALARQNLGQGAAAGATVVPEPAACALLAIGSLLLLRRRRQSRFDPA